MNYFQKNKEKILPWVTDWTSDQDDVRNANPAKLDFTTWFFCHPTAYQIVIPGTFFMYALFFLIGYSVQKYIILLIFSILSLLMCIYLWHKSVMSGITFYDLFFKQKKEEIK